MRYELLQPIDDARVMPLDYQPLTVSLAQDHCPPLAMNLPWRPFIADHVRAHPQVSDGG